MSNPKNQRKMKKVVRMLGLCALVALAFSSCKKNETESVSFTATITQPTTSVRTHVAGTNDYYLVWDQGDAIKVFDNNLVDENFTLTAGKDAVTATFRAVGQTKVSFLENLTSENYTAFYPNAVIDEENDQVNMNIPANQIYRPAHNFVTNLYPMVGFNIDPETGDNVDNFKFESKAGFLYLLFQAPEGETVTFDKVVVTTDEDNDYVSGTMVYEKDGTFVGLVGEDHVATITSTQKITVTYPALMDVTFVLPEGALESGFTVLVYDGEELIWGRHAPAGVNTIVAQQFREMPSMVLDGTLPED
jgi:hypothetical protein